MRILKGYSEEERKELEEAKNNHFGSAIDLIRGIVMGNNDCMYLARNYVVENPGKDNQLARDIADYYAGVAKFAKPKKYYVHLIKGDENSYLNITPVGGPVLGSHLEGNGWKNKFTHEEIISMNPQLLLFEEEAEED